MTLRKGGNCDLAMGMVIALGGGTRSSVNFSIFSSGLEMGKGTKGVIVWGAEMRTPVLAGALCSLMVVPIGKESCGDLEMVASSVGGTCTCVDFVISSSGLALRKEMEGVTALDPEMLTPVLAGTPCSLIFVFITLSGLELGKGTDDVTSFCMDACSLPVLGRPPCSLINFSTVFGLLRNCISKSVSITFPSSLRFKYGVNAVNAAAAPAAAAAIISPCIAGTVTQRSSISRLL